MDNRISVWDELRGVAILFMIITHFLYFKSKIFYSLSIDQLFAKFPQFYELIKGVINLHASYMAPYLFFFIVGVICHIKFTKATKPNINKASRRLLKLYIAAVVLEIVKISKHNVYYENVDFFSYLFTYKNILMIICYVYLISEFVLLPIFDYYKQSIVKKSIVLGLMSLIIGAFNYTTKTIYLSYHDLPVYFLTISGLFTALLGDYFLSVYEKIKGKDNQNKSILILICVALLICFASYVMIRPSTGAIKSMNLIYFFYCLSVSAIIIVIFSKSWPGKILNYLKNGLALMGRHSLILYLFHFYVGYNLKYFVLDKFFPEYLYPVNIIFVFILCLMMAKILDYIDLIKAHKLTRQA